MIVKDSTYRALARLEGNPDFAEVMLHVRACHEEANTRLRASREMPDIFRAQGKVELASELIEAAKNANSILQKIK
jgi:hypothetical protein